jgi:uncharacterized RDD family membrane protein YckC
MNRDDALTYDDRHRPDPDRDRPRPPKIPLSRRGWAFAIDFISAGLFSGLLGGPAFAFAFLLAWFGLRVIMPLKQRGQSLGRWAFDLKLIETRFDKTPSFIELCKREGITGIEALLAFICLVNLGPTSGSYLLLVLPLAIDCGRAFADPTDQSAFHDLFTNTVVVGSLRGYSLDVKVRKWVAIARQRMKQ